MDTISTLYVLLGVLIIATRGPMIFVPQATLRVLRRLVATDARVRVIGLLVVPLAAAAIQVPPGRPGAEVLRVLGWIWAGAALWIVLAPGSYRWVTLGVVDFFDSSPGTSDMRMIGVLAVALGAGLIYFGIYLL
jgi:hypothetical protein